MTAELSVQLTLALVEPQYALAQSSNGRADGGTSGARKAEGVRPRGGRDGGGVAVSSEGHGGGEPKFNPSAEIGRQDELKFR